LFEVFGHHDELNAVIVIAREHYAINRNGLEKKVIEIQLRLFDLGAVVVTQVHISSNLLELI